MCVCVCVCVFVVVVVWFVFLVVFSVVFVGGVCVYLGGAELLCHFDDLCIFFAELGARFCGDSRAGKAGGASYDQLISAEGVVGVGEFRNCCECSAFLIIE